MLKLEDKKRVSRFMTYLNEFIGDIKEHKVIEDYFEGIDLTAIVEKMGKDVAELEENIRKTYTFLQPATGVNQIIKISGGDGISYHQDDYIKITKITSNHIEGNVITVSFGDYGNSISYDEFKRWDKSDFIQWFEKNYHNTNTEENLPKFEEYKKYIDNLQEL